jgi:integrase
MRATHHNREKHYDGTVANPVQEVELLKEPKGCLRYLEPEEEASLLAAALSERHRVIILSGIYAGLRIESEALTLKRRDVDVQQRLLTVQAAYAKSGKTRTVPLNSVLKEALEKQLASAPGEYVLDLPRFGRRFRTWVSML